MAFCRFSTPRQPTFNWNQSLNKDEVKLIFILGDSWTERNRFKEFIVDQNPRTYIDTRPHATIADVPSAPRTGPISTSEGAFVGFLSLSGATLDRYLAAKKIQGIWARDVPEVTVLHVGACDIANTRKYKIDTIKKLFLEDLLHFLKQWPILAKEQLKGHSIADRRARAQFERQLVKHKWLIVKIPQWKGSDGIRGIEPEKFRQMKKRANTGLDNNKSRLWKSFRAVLLGPHIPYPQFKPGEVHLTKEDQSKFNEQVIEVANKLLCEFCPWTAGEYKHQEHKDLLNNRNKCCRPLDPRRNLIGSPFQPC